MRDVALACGGECKVREGFCQMGEAVCLTGECKGSVMSEN